jgi:hypothetical protein
MTYPTIRTTKAKAVAAAAGSLVTVLAGVFADDILDMPEAVSLVVATITAVLTVVAVFQVENKPVPPGQ